MFYFQYKLIQLYNQSAAWIKETKWGTTSVMEANAAILFGWWPSRKREGVPPPQPRWAPFCSGPNSSGDEGPLLWTGCQERMSMWATKDYYSFSPNMGTEFNSTFPGFNFTSIQYENFTYAANLSKVLSRHLLQNWTADLTMSSKDCDLPLLKLILHAWTC